MKYIARDEKKNYNSTSDCSQRVEEPKHTKDRFQRIFGDWKGKG